MLISIVVKEAIAKDSSKDVNIGVKLPLEGVKGTVSVQDVSEGGTTAGGYLSPVGYTVTVVDDDTVNIAVASDATALAPGDIVNIAAICRGEIARP